ncbi:Jasmonate O-methyltransferase [Hibiscus syriacus]|uniref:Jasmonate O-methyltransferase n=1 Tax=Hibiscus syriacus TaxID=106335 RepID=A0A6A2Z9I4_HIBSY|nr:jasmonate O-methyltransferase-like [Hibiscus syriacus]KAE8688654.1 Jasmonate O-methyltransferase [Hibiscus syriacus]
MEVIQVLHMNKGNGDTSYAKNSSVQREIISMGKTIIEEALLQLSVNNDIKSMGIADLGCSSGPNTLSVISEVVDVVRATCGHIGRPVPEFRLYLNDLYSNDFNYLFMSLPAFYKKLKEEKGVESHCFISGVPGSFYARLFPTNTLHFVYSFSSLHWLSQVPVGLESYAVKHLNKGKVYISKSSPQSVLNAYSMQFQADFLAFLKSRSEELLPGGRMVLSFLGRNSIDPAAAEACYQWELLAKALMNLVEEGLIEEEKVDSFNTPYYAPSAEEIKVEIEKEGTFIIDRLEAFDVDWDGGAITDIQTQQGKALIGERVAKTVRAVVESMLESHFQIGRDTMDVLFVKFSEIVGTYLSKTKTKYINFVISLVKKG